VKKREAEVGRVPREEFKRLFKRTPRKSVGGKRGEGEETKRRRGKKKKKKRIDTYDRGGS